MKTLVPVFLACLCLPAAAQTSPWYLGAAAGSSRTGHALVRDREANIGGGNEPNLQSATDLRDNAARLFAGYRLSPVFSVEANYVDLGRQRIDTTFDVPFGQTGRGEVLTTRRVDGWGIDLLAGMQILPNLRLFGKLGAFHARGEADTTISGDTSFADGTPGNYRRKSAGETIVKVGFGAEYAITKTVSARLEWERYPDLGKRLVPGASNATGEATQDAWWLAIVLRF